MSRLVLSSDLHLGHKNITRYRTMFATAEEHHEKVLQSHKDTIKKNDTWYCLGDVAFTKDWLLRLAEIKCKRKVLILGNHCSENLTSRDFLEVFDEVLAIKSHKAYGLKAWFTHCPIHPDEMRGKHVNIHGHTHYHCIKDNRYINVCVEHTNWGATPLQFIAHDWLKENTNG